jgi:predicted amidohydrolase
VPYAQPQIVDVTEPYADRRKAPEVFQVNKSVMVAPDGVIAYQYLKHNLLIEPESTTTVRGPRVIDSIQTPYGRLSSVICLDMEYPDFMRLAGSRAWTSC